MDYGQEISRRVYEGEVYQRRAAPVEAVEAAYVAKELCRTIGVARVAATSMDSLETLYGEAQAKAQRKPRMANEAYRLAATAAMIYERRLLWYGLN